MYHMWIMFLLGLGLLQGEARPTGPPAGHGYLMNSTLDENPGLDDRLNLGTQYFSLNSSLGCTVQAKDYNIPEHISKLVTDKTKLLEFDFTFEDYVANPLREDMFIAYKGNQWTLATTSQGKTILALAFDYGALSMMTLEFGVERMKVVLKDEPKGCLGNLSEAGKVEVMTLAGMRHYGGADQAVVIKPSQSLCHQVVQRRWGFALFTYQCCHLLPHSQKAECLINEGNRWLNIVDILLLSVRVFALFTIATEILAMVVRRNLVHVPYVIKRDVPLKMLLKILRVNVDENVTIKSISCETGEVGNIEDAGDEGDTESGDAGSQKGRKPQPRFSVQTDEGAETKCEMALDLRKERGFKKYKEFLEEQETKHRELSNPSDQMKEVASNDQKTAMHGELEKAIEVQMDRLHIAVDYDRLQEENDIPVGFFRSIYEAVFACGLRNSNTFEQCCKTNIFKVCSENSKLQWIHLFEPVGTVLLVLLVPTVFYIRIAFFYLFEDEEVSYRTGRARLVGLPIAPNKFNLIDYVKPTDPLFIVIYTLYISTILLVAYLFVVGDRNKFTHIITTTFMDIQQTRSSRVVMHFLKTLTLPFTRFGIVGCLLFPFYVLLVVPFILIIHIFYMLPLVYFTERIISNSSKYLNKERLNIKNKCLPMKPADAKNSVSPMEEFAELFPHREVKEMREREDKLLGSMRRREKHKKISCMRKALRILAVTMIILTMYGMSLLAAECVGFLAEMGTFTLMGIMINAGVYLKFVSLALLILVYCHTCFSGVHKKYLKLNKSLFQSIKRLMSNDIAEVTAQEEAYQENTAFKAESVRDNLERAKKAKAAEKERSAIQSMNKPNETQIEEPCDENEPLLQEGLPDMTEDTAIECSEESEDDLIVPKRHWLLNDVIFFIDKHDRPRIPQLLFEEVCNVDVDGSPGPVHESMFNSLKKLLTILMFLLFVFILISSFGAVYNVSSTNQMLATLAGGLLPLLMRTFMTPAEDSMELNSVSFENKLNQILKNMKQVWPIYDLELKEAVQDDGDEDDTKDTKDSEDTKDIEAEDDGRDKTAVAGALGASAIVGLREEEGGNNIGAKTESSPMNKSTKTTKDGSDEVDTSLIGIGNQINNNVPITSTAGSTRNDLGDFELKTRSVYSTSDTVENEVPLEPEVVHLVVISSPPS